MALTEESKPSGSDRETGASIETPAREKMAEVPSRAARVKAPPGVGSLGRPAQRYLAPPIVSEEAVGSSDLTWKRQVTRVVARIESRPLGGIFIFKQRRNYAGGYRYPK